MNCENDCRDAKSLNNSQANEEQPSVFFMKLQMGEVLRDEKPVVDGELHDGVVVDVGSEDPPPLLLLLYPLLCFLCV